MVLYCSDLRLWRNTGVPRALCGSALSWGCGCLERHSHQLPPALVVEAGSKTQIPSEELSSVPSALALLLGTLPLGAWGTRSPSARWFHRRGLEHPSSQAEEAQGDSQALQRVCDP